MTEAWMNSWRNISLWMDQLDDPLQARPSLQAQLHADVAVLSRNIVDTHVAGHRGQSGS